jgi:sec-independent protein translocase protein TatA
MVGLENPLHLVFLLLIVLLIFGAKRLPEMGRSLGSGLRGFKESLSGESGAHEALERSVQTAPAVHETLAAPRAASEPGAERVDIHTSA